MENFSEFDQRGTAPQPNFSDILSHTFNTYGKGIGWAILLIVITFVIPTLLSFVAGPLVGYNAVEASETMRNAGNPENPAEMMAQLMAIPGIQAYYGVSFLLSLLVYPLYAGFQYIFHKANIGESVQFSDLFIGFRQNFVQYLVFGLISMIVMSIAVLFCFFPVFLVAPLFFLGLPIIFFENATAMDALKKSFTIAKDNYGTMLGVSFISMIIAVAGAILCGIGIVITFPVYFAAMYSAYCAFAGTPRQLTS